MTHPLPSFPPLFPSGNWWRLFLKNRLDGFGTEKAVEAANHDSGLAAREWLRLKLKDSSMFSFPVAGGASALKNRDSGSWRFAKEIIRKRDSMLSTLATLYGKAPYFSLLADSLRLNTSDFGDDARVSVACRNVFREAVNILRLDDSQLLEMLKDKVENKDIVIRKIREELEDRCDLSLSILDPLMRLGPDTIFVLIPAF